jgi:arylsulfatase A-like enzyme
VTDTQSGGRSHAKNFLRGLLLAPCVLASGTHAFAEQASGSEAATSTTRPNIVVILTDDEDWKAHDYMPHTRRLLHEQGATFSQYVATYALCCPSRASILRGQYPQNTGVLGNLPPSGGFARFAELGDEASTVATWLQSAGYYTSLAGKYLNGYDRNSAGHLPPGWSDWHATLGHARYFGYDLAENGRIVHYGSGASEYQTDVLARIAVDAIRTAASRRQPLFLYVATAAPHLPAQPAPRHARLFEDVRLPMDASYDEQEVTDKPPIIRDNRHLTPADTQRFTRIYQRRLQALQAVDEAVEMIVGELARLGQLDNTYVIYTSDNGWHMGEHRLHAGKNTAYEEDIRLPLVIRGPGVPAGAVLSQLALNTDLAPTIAELAHVAAPDWVDGRSLVPLWSGTPTAWRKCALIQRGSSNQTQADDGDEAGPAYGFHALRTDQYAYVEWLSGDRELYDLLADPAELHNLYRESDPDFISILQDRVNQLANCKGAQCRAFEDRPISHRAP